MKAAWGALKSANGQKNRSTEKKQTGPPKGYGAKVTEDKIREAFKIEGRHTPQERLAELIDVDARTLRRWLASRAISYEQCQQQFS
jgi:hypothetical protein